MPACLRLLPTGNRYRSSSTRMIMRRSTQCVFRSKPIVALFKPIVALFKPIVALFKPIVALFWPRSTSFHRAWRILGLFCRCLQRGRCCRGTAATNTEANERPPRFAIEHCAVHFVVVQDLRCGGPTSRPAAAPPPPELRRV